MTRLDFLIRKNKGKNIEKEFLKEIRSLLCSNSYNILSLEESDRLLEKIDQHNIAKNEKKIFKTAFFDKSILQRIINYIAEVYKQEVFLSIGFSQYCGLVSLSNVSDFNIDFSFNSESSGLIVFYSKNLDNRLIIDSYEEDKKYYDLEISGSVWGRLNYYPAS